MVQKTLQSKVQAYVQIGSTCHVHCLGFSAVSRRWKGVQLNITYETQHAIKPGPHLSNQWLRLGTRKWKVQGLNTHLGAKSTYRRFLYEEAVHTGGWGSLAGVAGRAVTVRYYYPIATPILTPHSLSTVLNIVNNFLSGFKALIPLLFLSV